MGNLQVLTPAIDQYAYDGIILHRHYAYQLCTPSRASFLTGKYAFDIGELRKTKGKETQQLTVLKKRFCSTGKWKVSIIRSTFVLVFPIKHG